MKVNRGKDFAERVGWTLLQVTAGALLSLLQTGEVLAVRTIIYTVGIAALKVIVAQQVGQHGDGAAIPGGVIERTDRRVSG